MLRISRLAAAALVLIGGLIHFKLWSDGYRHIPYIGPLFLANLAASLVVATALVVTARRAVVSAAMLLSVGSLAALVVSRTIGLFGFMDTWTHQSIQVVAAELGAMIALGATVVTGRVQLHPARAKLLAHS